MTGIRQSMVFAAEPEFGKGNPFNEETGSYENPWLAPPPGTYVNTTHNRGVTRVNTAGSKHWATVAYGSLTGSFSWTFLLDYKYLAPLYFVFEDVSEDPETGEIVFRKADTKRVKPFTMRRALLNRMTYEMPDGDIYDEIIVNKGCIVREFRMSRTASESQFKVEITGSFASEEIILGKLPHTDYQVYDGELTEYSCLYIGNSAVDSEFVAVADSVAISIGNNMEMMYNVCSPFASTFTEGISNYSLNMSCYANDPYRYKMRLYNGGKLKDDTKPSGTFAPSSKGLHPMPYAGIYVYNRELIDGETPRDAYETSEAGIYIEITDTVINSLTWPKGDGSKIMDNISSAMCKYITMRVKVPSDAVYDPTNVPAGSTQIVTPVEMITEDTP